MHGWEHNYAYFVRCWVCSVVGTAALVLQVRNIFPDLAISTTEFFKIVFLTSGLCIAALIYTAGQWMFPVPAAMVVGLLPATALATSITFVIVGPKRIAQTSDVGNRVRRFAVLIVIKGLLPIIYGCFSSVYTTLASNHSSLAAQLVCSCTLPLAKHVLKHVLMRYATTRVDDYVPEIVVFSIDAFHVLYVCRCIVHTRTSPVFMTVCLVTLDLINHGISFCGIRRHTRTIQAFYVVPFFQRRCISSIATDILSHPERLDSRIFSSVRLRSCLKHRLSRQYVSHVAAPEPSPSQ